MLIERTWWDLLTLKFREDRVGGMIAERRSTLSIGCSSLGREQGIEQESRSDFKPRLSSP